MLFLTSIYVCGALPVCGYMYHMHASWWPRGPEEGIILPGLELQTVVRCHTTWELNPNSLKDQTVLNF